MRLRMLPLILAATALTATAALATTTSGTIKSIDPAKMEIVLTDGTLIRLPQGFKVDSLKAGERVNVTWEMRDGLHVASAVVPGA